MVQERPPTLTPTPVADYTYDDGPAGPPGDPATNLVTSVAGRQGAVVLTKTDVGLTNVNDTADVAKPVSTAQQVALDTRVPWPDMDSWPLWLYGNSYGVLTAAWLTTGNHYTQQIAAKLDGGAVTSYAVNGQRIHHVVYSLLSGVTPTGKFAAAVTGALWPGVSSRSGLVVIESIINDIGHYPAMNVTPVVPAVITSANTRYLDSMKALYRAALALGSTETRHEPSTGTFSTAGLAWTNQALADPAQSGGSVAYTSVVGSYWEKSVTPPQSGPLAGKVFFMIDTTDLASGTNAQITTTVDGASSVNYTPPQWEQYAGANGTQIITSFDVVSVTVPVDGAAHTVRITHAGSGGQFLWLDALLIPSETPNPVAVMGGEHPLSVHASVFNQSGINAMRYNAPLVIAKVQAAVAEFPNAFYVPSTMTSGGLYSGDGAHPNDRGQAQRAADLQTAITATIRARLASRVLANADSGSFAVL